MLLVADSFPIIFLGKVRRLDLVKAVWKGRILIPSAVHAEVLGPHLPPDEECVLSTFLGACEVVAVPRARPQALGLSRADSSVLALAREAHAGIILADDALLRRVGVAEGHLVVGTLGVLLRGAKAGHITGGDAVRALDELVGLHGFRIGIEIYREAQRTLGQSSRN